MQQVSGGFGDSNSMDPETMRILKENQAKLYKDQNEQLTYQLNDLRE